MKYHKLGAKNYGIFTCICVFFLLAGVGIVNIIASQSVPPLYWDVVNEKQTAVSFFLQKMMGSSDFNRLLAMNEGIYGASLKKEVFQDTLKRESAIRELETILHINPKARDVLVALSTLYEQERNYPKAQEYFRKAIEIDPQIQSLK